MLYYICGKYVYYCMFVYGNYRAVRLFKKSLLFQDQKGLFNLVLACIVDGDFLLPNEIDS